MRHLFKLFAIFTFAALIITACSDDEENPVDDGDNGEDTEYEAEDSDFAGFMDWELVAENSGVDPSVEAHGLNNEDVVREVYIKDGLDRVDGEYPKGTIVVKYSYNTESDEFQEYTAMVKRGGDFNPSGNGWEWFQLVGDGEIQSRSDGELNASNCINCHNQASSTDFVFSGN